MTRKILTGLSSQAYEHPFDRQALTALKKMPGISLLLKKINEYGIDRLLRLLTLGSEIKVTPRNFPQLHQTLVEACEILDITPLPELHLSRGQGHVDSYSIGVEKPIVGINLDAMEWLSADELIYIFGHEIAHIKSQHMMYHQMAFVMPALKHLLSSTTMGFGGLAASGLELALHNWRMMAELTADRAGLLACQDINVAINTLLKLAGLPNEYLTPPVIEDFLVQAREFSSDSFDNIDQVTKIFSYTEYHLSWVVMRASELLKWIDSGEYDNLIQDNNLKTPEETEKWNFLTSW
ncbi:M48 family metallopeptidase [Nostoc sp. UHCC 0702]|nr:M48 family metallopeptidase [Nostoc sp. UHCC 0702]